MEIIFYQPQSPGWRASGLYPRTSAQNPTKQRLLINILFMTLLIVIQYKFHVPILFYFEFQASWRGLGAIIDGKNRESKYF